MEPLKLKNTLPFILVSAAFSSDLHFRQWPLQCYLNLLLFMLFQLLTLLCYFLLNTYSNHDVSTWMTPIDGFHKSVWTCFIPMEFWSNIWLIVEISAIGSEEIEIKIIRQCIFLKKTFSQWLNRNVYISFSLERCKYSYWLFGTSEFKATFSVESCVGYLITLWYEGKTEIIVRSIVVYACERDTIISDLLGSQDFYEEKYLSPRTYSPALFYQNSE